MEERIKYAILQNEYRKINNNQKDIFPSEWYNIKDDDLKKKILQECIENNILIYDSKYYYEFRMKALNNGGLIDKNNI